MNLEQVFRVILTPGGWGGWRNLKWQLASENPVEYRTLLGVCFTDLMCDFGFRDCAALNVERFPMFRQTLQSQSAVFPNISVILVITILRVSEVGS
jgi:hypothetical protein